MYMMTHSPCKTSHEIKHSFDVKNTILSISGRCFPVSSSTKQSTIKNYLMLSCAEADNAPSIVALP